MKFVWCGAGQMGDAAEVLGALYEKLAAVASEAGQPTLLNDNFGLHVQVVSLLSTVCAMHCICKLRLAQSSCTAQHTGVQSHGVWSYVVCNH